MDNTTNTFPIHVINYWTQKKKGIEYFAQTQMQPDGVNLYYLKFRLFDLYEFIV